MLRTRFCCGFALLLLAVTAPADEAREPRPAVERKLLGQWRGGPCMGTLRFFADGRFEREHYSPGDNRISGTWELRWNALPPTLVMHGTASDDPWWVDRDITVTIVELNDDALRYQTTADGGTTKYERVKPQPTTGVTSSRPERSRWAKRSASERRWPSESRSA